jgi:hypothetical protein
MRRTTRLASADVKKSGQENLIEEMDSNRQRNQTPGIDHANRVRGAKSRAGSGRKDRQQRDGAVLGQFRFADAHENALASVAAFRRARRISWGLLARRVHAVIMVRVGMVDRFHGMGWARRSLTRMRVVRAAA